MAKKQDKVKYPPMTQDALFFMHKIFPETGKARVILVDLKGKKLTPRAIEAACSAIEADYLDVDSAECLYTRRRKLPPLTLKLQRVREMYEAFDIFVQEEPKQVEASKTQTNFSESVTDVLAILNRVQSDLIQALQADCGNRLIQSDARRAIRTLRRLATEGLNGLESMLERDD